MGKWVKENARPRSWIFLCDQCGGTAYFPVPKYFPKGCGYRFCPWCGAAMEEDTGRPENGTADSAESKPKKG